MVFKDRPTNKAMGKEDELIKPLANLRDKFDFDIYLKNINCEFGRYQRFLICLLCIPACFLSAFASMDLVFISFTPDHRCDTNTTYQELLQNGVINESAGVRLDSGQCDYRILTNSVANNDAENASVEQHQCRHWTYDRTYFDQTTVTQWNLVCNKAIVAKTILSLVSLPALLAIIYSYIQDKWGRKKAYLMNLTVLLLGNSSSLMATSPLMYAVLKSVACISCMWEISYCWALEFVGPSQRTTLTTVLSVTYGVAVMSLALIAYLCRTWVEVGVCTSAPFVLLYLYAFVIPESPRWLLSHGRVDEAMKFFATMTRWENLNVDLVELRYVLKSQRKEEGLFESRSSIAELSGDSVSSAKHDADEHTVMKFFTNANLRWKCALLTIICIISNQLYLAVPYFVENFETNFYLSYVLQAAVEAPATFLNLFLLNRYGRILPLSVSLFLSGTFCLLAWPAGHLSAWGPVVTTILSRFFVCIAVAVVEQLGGELFPTVYRGISQGVTNFAMTVVNLSSQYILYSAHVWKVLPLMIMGCLIILVGVLALFLPETKDLSLPDTPAQAELQGSVGTKALRQNLRLGLK